MNKLAPTAKEIESLHVAFRRAGELLAAGPGAWRISGNALKAMRAAVRELAAFEVKYSNKE